MECRGMKSSSMDNKPNGVTIKKTPQSDVFSIYSGFFQRVELNRIVAILGYLTLAGWLIAILLRGKTKSAFACFHLRQSLGIIITGAFLSLIPLIGWLLNVLICLAWLVCLYQACQGHKYLMPFLGQYYQRHLDFIE